MAGPAVAPVADTASAASPWAGGSTPAHGRPVPQHRLPAVPPRTRGPVATPLPAQSPSRSGATPAAGPKPHRVVQLLWHHERAHPRALRHDDWQPLIKSISEQEVDEALESEAQSAQAAERHRVIAEVLSHAPVMMVEDIQSLFVRSARADRKRIPPLVLVGGMLALAPAPHAQLAATLALMKPAAEAEDSLLQSALLDAERMLDSTGRDPLRCRRQLAALHAAYSQQERVLSLDSLKRHATQLTRSAGDALQLHVLNAMHTRAELHCYGNSDGRRPPAMVYLPAGATDQLPVVDEMEIHLLAAIHLRQEETCAQPLALQALAIGRVMHIPRL